MGPGNGMPAYSVGEGFDQVIVNVDADDCCTLIEFAGAGSGRFFAPDLVIGIVGRPVIA